MWNQYANMLMSQYLPGDRTAHIQATLDPMPLTAEQKALRSSVLGILISIGFAFIPANFASWVVKERSTKAKHQQLISGMWCGWSCKRKTQSKHNLLPGVNTFAYWGSNFIWDTANFLVPGILCLIVLAIFDLKELIGWFCFLFFVFCFLFFVLHLHFAFPLKLTTLIYRMNLNT
jgi:ATP-binding cassette subfamily A (ABC1) protein 3